MQDDLAPVFEINGDAVANNRLDLAQPPIGTVAVPHDGADLESGL